MSNARSIRITPWGKGGEEMEGFRIMSKEELMQHLGIEPNQLVTENHTVTEKLFCAAILDAGTEITAQILRKYHVLRGILYG